MKSLYRMDDIIVACASPPGGGARCIVRLSGPGIEAVACASGCFTDPGGHPYPEESWQGHARLEGLFQVASGNDSLSFPASAYVMRAPASYTREEMIEFHLPGAPALADLVIDTLICSGTELLRSDENLKSSVTIRLAAPGEFTMRAFINGRIDLVQAEAVERIIASGSEAERRAALANMEGAFSERISSWQSRLTGAAAQVEGQIDFAEDEVEPLPSAKMIAELSEISDSLQKLLATAQARPTHHGAIPVCFAGLTNAGKSSLLNAMLGQDAALVSPERSTTRDRLDFELVIEPFHFLLQDAPGLDHSGDSLSLTASKRGIIASQGAAIVLLVIDGSLQREQKVVELIKNLPEVPIVIACNKSDLPGFELKSLGNEFAGLIAVSAKTGEGLDELRRALVNIAARDMERPVGEGAINLRLVEELQCAHDSLGRAMALLAARSGFELIAEELRGAHSALGHIRGQGYAEEVLESIFSRFCIGK
ncbi:MAG: 50S ribosome-binding GTPase [Planctomycetes bacterium]|nr:50S ribosome-binding GTPase [Planctomycetota bacterium]